MAGDGCCVMLCVFVLLWLCVYLKQVLGMIISFSCVSACEIDTVY